MKKAFIVAIWLTLCGIFGYYAPALPLIKDFVAIKEVRIKGTDKLKEEDIKDIFKNENWLFVSEKRLENKFKRFGFIDSIRLNKPSYGIVDITVKEKIPYGVVKFKNKNFIVDDRGYIIKDPSYYDVSDLKLINLEDSEIERTDISNLKLIEDRFKDIKFKEFVIKKSSIYCITEDGKLLVFSRENIEDSIKKAQIFMSKVGIRDYSYINFTFDIMVITKK
ncbi:MAG: FtsQ-type POTRA domain-containing protein [Hydrogenothermaceae bacterium]|nr:FtsQ-type POTRA domain-containing protein [Hydrogenothermaceae bacterium]